MKDDLKKVIKSEDPIENWASVKLPCDSLI